MMNFLNFSFHTILVLLLLPFISSLYIRKPKVVIVGAGIGGASLSHFLSERFSDIEIILLEKSDEFGGRLSSIEITKGHSSDNTTNDLPEQNKTVIELGASFFIKENKNLINLARFYHVDWKSADDEEKDTMGLWDGEKFLWETSKFEYLTLAKLLWRYGKTPFNVKTDVDEWVKQFGSIYSNVNKPFNDYKEFLERIGHKNASSTDFLQYLRGKNYNELYVNEFITGVIAGIYNQRSSEMQSFAGMISLAGVFGKAYSFKKGNKNLASSIIKGNPRVKAYINSEVIMLEKREDGKFSLDISTPQGLAFLKAADVIIFTSPIDEISFRNINITEKNKNFGKKYVRTYVTVVAGQLNCEYFEKNRIECPGSILATRLKEKSIISDYFRVCQKCYDVDGELLDVYKFQSIRKLKEFDLHTLFPYKYKALVQKIWKGYPNLVPIDDKDVPDIRLQNGLYFLNGIEALASCMEIESIAARNIAGLIANNEGKNWAQINILKELYDYEAIEEEKKRLDELKRADYQPEEWRDAPNKEFRTDEF